MTLELTSQDEADLAGERGPAVELAMRIIVRMAEVQEAPGLLDITQAHIDSSLYMGRASLEFAERLAGLGAKVAVPTTLNVSGVDEHHWREWAVPEDWAVQARRHMAAYEAMGCRPTWTCAPYQLQGQVPRFGEQIAWGESNAIVFANSVLGARTERYPDFMDICAAVAARVPAVGLHLTENRAGQLLVELVQVPSALQEADELYPVLGHLLGRLAGERVPVITGLGVRATEDQLKALGAAASSSGVVALFHIVGLTPEAPTLEAAFQGRPPAGRHKVGLPELRAARAELTTAEGEALDLVVLGSPHFSLAEFARLAPFLEGRRRHPDVELLVTTGRGTALLARQKGYLQALEAFGGRVTVDTCILTSPMLPPRVRRLMTNSAKYAYYTPGLLEREIAFGSLEDCVRSAVEGRIVRDDRLWASS